MGHRMVIDYPVRVVSPPGAVESMSPALARWLEHTPGGHQHNQLSHAGDGLGLAARILLGDGESFVSSGRLDPDGDDDVDFLHAVVDTPRGQKVRVGILPREDAERWRAGNKGATVDLDTGQVRRLHAELSTVGDKAKPLAKARDKAYDDGLELDAMDPVLRIEEPVAEGRLKTEWGDLTYETWLTDDDPTSWEVDIKVDDDEMDPVRLNPKDLRKLLGKLDELGGAALEAVQSPALARWLEHGTHDQRRHGRRYKIPGDKRSGVLPSIADLRKLAEDKGVTVPKRARKADIAKMLDDAGPREKPKADLFPGRPRQSEKLDAKLDAAFGPAKRTDEQVQRQKVDAAKADIRTAVGRLEREPGAWVGLARLRDELGERHNRHDVDQALTEMSVDEDVSIVPESNQKVLRQKDRDAEVVIGNQRQHVIAITPPLDEGAHDRVRTGGVRSASDDDLEHARRDSRTRTALYDEIRAEQKRRAGSSTADAVRQATQLSDTTGRPSGLARATGRAELIQRLENAGSEDEVRELLAGRSVAELRDIAAAIPTVMPARNKNDLIFAITRGTVGFREDSEAMLPGGFNRPGATVDASTMSADDKLRVARLMFGDDESKWPAHAKRDAARMRAKAAAAQARVARLEQRLADARQKAAAAHAKSRDQQRNMQSDAEMTAANRVRRLERELRDARDNL